MVRILKRIFRWYNSFIAYTMRSKNKIESKNGATLMVYCFVLCFMFVGNLEIERAFVFRIVAAEHRIFTHTHTHSDNSHTTENIETMENYNK